MLVYRESVRPCRPRHDLQEVIDQALRLAARRGTSDEWLAVLIDAGELHAACADALTSAHDCLDPAQAGLGDVLRVLAGAWLDARVSRPSDVAGPLSSAWNRCPTLPATAERRVPKGFAYYALYPETFAAAVVETARARAAHDAVVIGVRSIGSTLAAVTSEALARHSISTWTWTVRPRGHPFDRRVLVERTLESALTARRSALHFIVDEGPGLSGSSMAAVAAQLRAVGVRDEDIVLVPASRPDPASLRSASGREAFTRHAIATASFDTHVLARGLHRHPAGALVDVSAGAWRAHVRDVRSRAPVHPHHERRKYLARSDASSVLLTYEGLGRYGHVAKSRAERLAGEGFVVEPGPLESGFLAATWKDDAAHLPRVVGTGLASSIGQYLGWIARHEATGRAADTRPLAQMLEANAREAFGGAAAKAAASLSRRAERTEGPEARLDARVLRHEWLVENGRALKTDALHHHDDHFYPGPSDPAWDVAATILELGLSDASSSALLSSYRRVSHDGTVIGRLPFFSAAYAAFRFGYASLAAETLGTAGDGPRFARAASRYRRHLEAALFAGSDRRMSKR